jgi:MFS family permease
LFGCWFSLGLILSGNEVSQILLSVILAYFGGQRNRPRLIAWGVVFCSLSCFILAMPHFIFGAGDDALKLTKEWFANSNVTTIDDREADKLTRKANRLCMLESLDKECNDEIESILPLILIFLSQFVLGIGNTLYYALGQTYLDDNTKKTNSPLLMSYAFTFRTLGPGKLIIEFHQFPNKFHYCLHPSNWIWSWIRVFKDVY